MVRTKVTTLGAAKKLLSLRTPRTAAVKKPIVKTAKPVNPANTAKTAKAVKARKAAARKRRQSAKVPLDASLHEHRKLALDTKYAIVAGFRNYLNANNLEKYIAIRQRKTGVHIFSPEGIDDYKVTLNDIVANIPENIAIDTEKVIIDKFDHISLRIRKGSGKSSNQININPKMTMTVTNSDNVTKTVSMRFTDIYYT